MIFMICAMHMHAVYALFNICYAYAMFMLCVCYAYAMCMLCVCAHACPEHEMRLEM